MRAPALLVTTGLSAALLLTGCGGSDDESPAAAGSSSSVSGSSSSGSSSPSSPSSSGAPGSTGAPAEAAAFCSAAVSLEDAVNGAVGQAETDPTQLAPALQQLADQYADVEAPQEIAGDWGTLVNGIQQLATAAEDIDFTDPSAAEQLQASVGGLEEQLTTATTNVSTYAVANCPQAAPAS
jgi:hypothetical protein